ncbi:hypothetical protein ACFL96_16215 [Thermoproteota archaeon]
MSEALRQAQEAQKKKEKADSEAQQQLSDLRQRIKAGEETTGDNVDDFMLVIAGLEDYQDIGKRLKLLRTEIEENQGQQVLVLEGQEHIGGCTGFGGSGYYESSRMHRLGVLEGEIDFMYPVEGEKRTMFSGSRPSVVIPTAKYAQKGSRFRSGYDDKWELGEGLLEIGMEDLLGWGNDLPDRGMIEPVRGGVESLERSLQILIGEEAVELYHRVPGYQLFGPSGVFNRRKEGKLSDEELEELLNGFFKDHADLGYVDALRLIDHSVPEYFQTKYDTFYENKRQKVIKDLFELVDIMDPLVSKEELHWSERDKLKDARKKMTGTLKEAFELNLHKDERELVLRPGMRVDVPEYITGMCEQYDIEIPE